MAIQLTVQAIDNFGQQVTLSNCYCKISFLKGDKYLIHFSVDFWSQDKTKLYKTEMFSFTPSVVTGSLNFIEQAYVYLKTLPEFNSGTDC